MEENKKSKAAGISIGIIVLVVFLGFGFLIGFAQTRSAQNLAQTNDEGPYADFYFNKNGELIYYAGDESEVVVPETYSINTIAQTKEIVSQNVNELTNIAAKLGLEDYTILATQVPSPTSYGKTVTEYTLKFRFFGAVAGSDYTVTRIAERAFTDNTKITRVELPQTVTYLGETAFAGCTKLKEVVLPPSLDYMGQYQFQNCSSLTSITIPKNLTDINYGSFMSCSNLQSVEMSDDITCIGSQVFYYCKNLKSIKLPANLQRIESNAFYYTGLEEIDIPASVNYISNRAFWGCNNLTKVVLRSSMVVSADSSIFSTNRKLKIYVNDDLYDSYKQSYPWSEYSSNIYKISEME